MARVRLAFRMERWPAAAGNGALGQVALPRLMCLLLVTDAARTIAVDALLDTGSHLSVFPERVWRRFESAIDWLPLSDTMPPLRVSAGELPFRLGRLIVAVADPNLNDKLDPISTVVMFAQDEGGLKHPLVGLGCATLRGRRLQVEFSARKAWLEEA